MNRSHGWFHKLFFCPTWWSSWYKKEWRMNCPKCGRRIRCYWDGNDIDGHGIDYCDKCTTETENNDRKTK